MESEQEILASLLKDRPDNFDELKDWANLQLAVRSATRKESFLQRIGGLATTVTAIIGVLTASITAIQLWNKIEDDRKDQVDRFRMEALKLYVDNWQQFSDPANCGRFTVFAAAVKDQYLDLSDSVNKDYRRVCGFEVVAATVSNITPSAGGVADATAGANYASLQQVTPDVRAAAPAASSYSGLTVYIQFKKGSPDAEKLAGDMKSFVGGTGAKAPGIEGVASVPKNDEIRIYKDAQKDLATALAGQLEERFKHKFSIVSLEKRYSGLPANTMEIWLGDSGGSR